MNIVYVLSIPDSTEGFKNLIIRTTQQADEVLAQREGNSTSCLLQSPGSSLFRYKFHI